MPVRALDELRTKSAPLRAEGLKTRGDRPRDVLNRRSHRACAANELFDVRHHVSGFIYEPLAIGCPFLDSALCLGTKRSEPAHCGQDPVEQGYEPPGPRAANFTSVGSARTASASSGYNRARCAEI